MRNRDEAVNAMLLNEFLKEHRKVEEQSGKQQKSKATVAQQQKEIQDLTAALKAHAAQIQKVSDQLAIQAPAARVVANDWIAMPGILEGAAGVALALLAASTPVEPEWDRMLLLSGRSDLA